MARPERDLETTVALFRPAPRTLWPLAFLYLLSTSGRPMGYCASAFIIQPLIEYRSTL
jgi:hypothetical protein